METEPESIQFLVDLPIIFLSTVSSIEILIGFLVILVLILFSALVSGSEVAFFSLTANDLEDLKHSSDQRSHKILRLKEKPRLLLATILISNNFINIAIVILSEFIISQMFDGGAVFLVWANALIEMGWPFSSDANRLSEIFQFIITVLGVTFILVLFGEVAPKIYAKIHNVQLAKFMAGPLAFLMNVFGWPSRMLVQGTNIIEKRLEKRKKGTGFTSLEEIDEAIDLTVSQESYAKEEIDILKNIVKFGEVSVKQIMRSRVDVVAVDFRTSFEELIDVVKESGFSRIPVYENDFDNITGILYAKDLLGHIHEKDNKFEWQELIRMDILYVPEAKKIDDLLREFQKKHLHMAIVVDEYGGTAGIVTLEDILEEIIGEIKDEFDLETEVKCKKIDDYNFVFDGKTLLNDIYRILDIDNEVFDEIRGDADSLAGLVLELLGQMPEANAVVEYNNFKFKIVSITKRRIKDVQITIPIKKGIKKSLAS